MLLINYNKPCGILKSGSKLVGKYEELNSTCQKPDSIVDASILIGSDYWRMPISILTTYENIILIQFM